VFQILVPTDFSSPTALRVATSFSQAFGSTIDILHVLKPKAPIRPRQIEKKFRKFLPSIPATVLERVRMKLASGDLVERVVETANDGYDFVLIGGSMADTGGANEMCRAISPHVGCPVLRVSEPDLRAFDVMETLLGRLQGARTADRLAPDLADWGRDLSAPSTPAAAFR
jgi:hypothetical protein